MATWHKNRLMQSDFPREDEAPGRDSRPPEQFMRLFLGNQKRFYGLILSLVNNPPDADDLLQEVSIRMWQKFSEFEPGTDFVAWGLRFCRFEAMNFLKKRRRSGLVTFDDELLEALADEVTRESAAIDVRQQALLGCIDKLPEHTRLLVELRYEPGATPKSVATRLGRSLEAVYKALNRAHHALMDCVERALQSEGRA